MMDDLPESTRKLVAALEAAGARPEMVEAARNGRYHDFMSDLAMPMMELMRDATIAGLATIVKGVLNGDFDATMRISVFTSS